MPVTLGDPVAVVLALGADDLVDLERHQLVHNAEPNADAERQQSLPRCPHQLAERLLDLRWQRTLRPLQRGHDRRRGYLAHGGSSCPRGLGWRLSRSQRERTRREDRRSKFYEIPDNLSHGRRRSLPDRGWLTGSYRPNKRSGETVAATAPAIAPTPFMTGKTPALADIGQRLELADDVR